MQFLRCRTRSSGATVQCLALIVSVAAAGRGRGGGVHFRKVFVEAPAGVRLCLRLAEESPSPVVAVSHGVFIRILLAAQVLGMVVTDYRRLRLDNARWVGAASVAMALLILFVWIPLDVEIC